MLCDEAPSARPTRSAWSGSTRRPPSPALGSSSTGARLRPHQIYKYEVARVELCLLTGHRLSSPASKCSLAGFSLSKTPHSSPPPAHGGLGGSRSRSSSRRLRDERRFLRSLWYHIRSVPTLVWLQRSGGHGSGGADFFCCRLGKLIGELASVPCPSKPASCRISSDIIIPHECCRCSGT